MDWADRLAILAGGAAAAAAIVSTVAARIKIRDSLDYDFIDMERQSKWTAWGAYLNVIASAAVIGSLVSEHFR